MGMEKDFLCALTESDSLCPGFISTATEGPQLRGKDVQCTQASVPL